MKRLVLLANSFPYGKGEAYLETEVKYYSGFDEIYVCALNLRKAYRDTLRKLPDERFHVIPVPFRSKARYLANTLFVLGNRDFYHECKKLIHEKRFNIKRLVRLCVFLSRADLEKKVIIRYFRENGIEMDASLIYAYRFEYQAYLAVLMSEQYKNCKVVARAHGYDLYEEINSDKYIPLRERVFSAIDRVFLISDHGKRYLSNKYPGMSSKMTLSRLGTLDHGYTETHLDPRCVQIVSCSNVVPVKRLDRIVDALSLITDIPVKWTHFGDGALFEEIKQRCSGLPDNIEVVFAGKVFNEGLMKRYRSENYHALINVSESEGVPVSIMEAMSFGIPCIATDVGGTGEIIDDGVNGFLLSGTFEAGALAKAIRHIAEMDGEQYRMLRLAAREKWQACSSADVLYRKFVDELLCELDD